MLGQDSFLGFFPKAEACQKRAGLVLALCKDSASTLSALMPQRQVLEWVSVRTGSSLQPGCSVPGLPWPVHTEPSTVLLSSMGTLSVKQEKTRYSLCISRGACKVRAGWLPPAPGLPDLSDWMPFTGGCSTSLHSACFAFQAGGLLKAQLRLPQHL